jgi:hypothetical protein
MPRCRGLDYVSCDAIWFGWPSSRSRDLASAGFDSQARAPPSPAARGRGAVGRWRAPDCSLKSPASQCPGTMQLGSASPPSAFGESVERGEHFRRTPHSVAGSTGRLDEDSRLGERVEVAVSVGGLDAQLLSQ